MLMPAANVGRLTNILQNNCLLVSDQQRLKTTNDKAFDSHLIIISSEDYTIKISTKLKKKDAPGIVSDSFLKIEGSCGR